MKTLVLLIAAFAFAGQILIARSKKCTTADDCQDVANSNNQCNTVKTKTETCECNANYVPTATGCGNKLAVPVITAASTDIKVDGQLELTCTSASETSDMTYKWTRGDTPVKGQTEKTLKIEKVTLKDAGKYVCTTIDVNITPDHADSKAKEVKITAKNGVAQVAGSVLVVMAALVTSKLF